MNKNYDINKKNNLAKRRKKPNFILMFIVVTLTIALIITSSFATDFSSTAEEAEIFRVVCYVAIVVCVLLLLLLILRFIRPTYILQNDLKYIYIVKKYNKILEISVEDIKKTKAKVKSGKKAKKEYGTLIIYTTKRKYKVRNIYNVSKVKEEIKQIVEKLQIYLEGLKEGAKGSTKKRRFFKR